MKKVIALIGGIAGAATVAGLHEIIKVAAPSVAPRMDLLDMEAINKVRERVHLPTLPEDKLFKPTTIAEIVAYTFYYSLAGGKAADLKGTTLGIAAGLAAVHLPEKLNLDAGHSRRTKTTEYLTVALYIAGGLAAAGTIGGLTQLTDKAGRNLKKITGKAERKLKSVKTPKLSAQSLRRKLHL